MMNRSQYMAAGIKCLLSETHIAGQAITIDNMVGNNLMSHMALGIAQPGDVIVIDAKGHLDTSVWGGIQTISAKKNGLAGVVIDGTVRDRKEIVGLGFPVFCRGVTGKGAHKGWADNINVPISCGGVPVLPGDLILGDDDGVAVIPFDQAEAVLATSRKRMEEEKEWIRGIEAGQSTLEAINLRKNIDFLKIETYNHAWNDKK